MGRGSPDFVVWSYIANLGAMIDQGAEIQVRCQTCKVYRRFTRADLEALAEKVGRDYSLVNRRCRCRLTPGCTGWNVFDYLRGVYRPLRDRETGLRWSAARE